jgi:hypothetical protein
VDEAGSAGEIAHENRLLKALEEKDSELDTVCVWSCIDTKLLYFKLFHVCV